MKKNVFLSLVGAAALAFGLVSCEKQSVLNLETVSETAIITGYAEMNNGEKWDNDINTAVPDQIPAVGKTVVVEIANSEFVNGSEGVQFFETTVDSKGYFRIEVKINLTKSIDADVYLKGFEGSVTEYEDIMDKSTAKSVKVLYEGVKKTVAIGKNKNASTGTLFLDYTDLK